MLAPGDDVSTRYETELNRTAQTGEGRKLSNVDFVSPPGFGVGEVGKPFQFGRNLSELAELGARQRRRFVRRAHVRYWNQVLRHACPRVSPASPIGTVYLDNVFYHV